MDQRGSLPLKTALPQPQQCRDCQKTWAPGFLGSVQGPSAGFVKGSAQATGNGTGKHPYAVGANEAKVFTQDSHFRESSYLREKVTESQYYIELPVSRWCHITLIPGI